MPLHVRTEDEPNNELRVRSNEVPKDDLGSTRVKKLIDELTETMVRERGCGIAAPQVGVHERIIVVDAGAGPTAYVNPEITGRSFRTVLFEEGCLSVPGVWGMVKRCRGVKVKAFDRDGGAITLEADGLEAIILQHEIDHLDGILFIDRVETFTRPPNHAVL
jgi:peptide deformylase